MKKSIAVLLAALMTLAASCALAATDVTFDTGLPNFDVRFVSDNDVPVEAMAADGACVLLFGDVRSEDPDHLQLYVTLATSEESAFDGTDLANATNEQIEGLFNYVTGSLEGESDGNYVYTTVALDDQVKALCIYDAVLRDQVQVVTLKDGVFVSAFASYPDFDAVTDEDIDYAVQLLDALQFVPKEAAPLLDGEGGEVEAAAN